MKRRIYIASLEERRCYRDQYKVVQPYQGGGSDTVETEERTEYKQIVQWKRETWPVIRWIPTQHSGHRGHHGHGHLRQGLLGGIVPHHCNHGDSHHDQPQLTSQQTSWTVEHVLQNTSTGRPGVVRQISERSISRTSSNRQSMNDTANGDFYSCWSSSRASYRELDYFCWSDSLRNNSVIFCGPNSTESVHRYHCHA